MTEYPRLEIGQTAPAFTLKDHNGEPVSLGDFAGRKTILYFYPAALTPGCSKEACDFNALPRHKYGILTLLPPLHCN